jgi:lipoprotein NlpD
MEERRLALRVLAFVATLALSAVLAGCGSAPSRAPVIDRLPAKPAAKAPSPAAAKEPDWRPATYTVQKGDTLFSIALEHGQDYRELAEWNGIQEPYVIRIGQVLRLSPPGGDGAVPLALPTAPQAKPLPGAEAMLKTEPKAVKEAYSDQALARLEQGPGKPEAAPAAKLQTATAETAKPEAKVPPAAEAKAADDAANDPDRVEWAWPASGKILANFNDNGNSKGLDIAGSLGQPVNAAAAGKVVHTGTTLRGYGKLIIIKHNKSYFSVYAHNSQILVKEGQTVMRGQKIAEMGDTDADRVKLHFEIRRLGKPVDPLKYLPNDRTP